jgi:hypothetical protein
MPWLHSSTNQSLFPLRLGKERERFVSYPLARALALATVPAAGRQPRTLVGTPLTSRPVPVKHF